MITNSPERSTTPEPPYCWQNKSARRLIRRELDGDTLQKIALAVYDALTEIASNETKSTFTASQPHIGELAGGYDVRSIQRVLPILRDLGIIHYVTATGKLRGPITYSLLSVATSSRNDTSDEPLVIESHSRRTKELTTELTVEKKGLPSSLLSGGFPEVWNEWLQYRRESGLSPWAPRTLNAKLEEMAIWGVTISIRAIKLAISNGYKGIEHPDIGRRASRPNPQDTRALKLSKEIGGGVRIGIPILN